WAGQLDRALLERRPRRPAVDEGAAMRIARFEHDGTVRVGAVDGDSVRPFEAGVDVYDLLEDPAARDAALAAASDPVALDGMRLLAPLVPHSMRDFMTFEEHLEGTLRAGGPEAKIAPEWYEAPRFYFTNVAAVTGPYDDVAIAPGSEVQDFELEV